MYKKLRFKGQSELTNLFSNIWSYTRTYSMNEIPTDSICGLSPDLWTDFWEMKNSQIGGRTVY